MNLREFGYIILILSRKSGISEDDVGTIAYNLSPLVDEWSINNDIRDADNKDWILESYENWLEAKKNKNDTPSQLELIVKRLKVLYNSEFPFNNYSSRDWFAEIANILSDEPIPQWALDEYPDLKQNTIINKSEKKE